MFLAHNTELVPPYRVLIDTNFINFSLQNKLELVSAMMDCLYAKCVLSGCNPYAPTHRNIDRHTLCHGLRYGWIRKAGSPISGSTAVRNLLSCCRLLTCNFHQCCSRPTVRAIEMQPHWNIRRWLLGSARHCSQVLYCRYLWSRTPEAYTTDSWCAVDVYRQQTLCYWKAPWPRGSWFMICWRSKIIYTTTFLMTCTPQYVSFKGSTYRRVDHSACRYQLPISQGSDRSFDTICFPWTSVLQSRLHPPGVLKCHCLYFCTIVDANEEDHVLVVQNALLWYVSRSF